MWKKWIEVADGTAEKREMILTRVAQENYECATMRPRYVHSYFMSANAFGRSSVNRNAPTSRRGRARISSYPFSQPSLSPDPPGPPRQNHSLRRPGEDIRFAFDERWRCRNPRHSFARSRNVKWPRTWLACLHSGSRRLNDVDNEWDQSIHRAVCRFPDEGNQGSDGNKK